jgi:hypothetical protein
MKVKLALAVVLFLSLSNLYAQKNDHKGVDAVYHCVRACLNFIQWIPYATFWLQLR